MTDGDYVYCGKHRVMYRIAKSCCTSGMNVIPYVNYTSVKKNNGKKVNYLKIMPDFTRNI